MAKVPIANQAPTEAMQKIMDREIEDWDQIEKQPRIGFFSITPNKVLRDCYQSLKKEYHHKLLKGKIKTKKTQNANTNKTKTNTKPNNKIYNRS